MIEMGKYYKSACLLLIFCILICCGPKRDEGEAKLFSLEKVLTVDTENDQIAETGLTDIMHFDIDSGGKIFIANLKAKENHIFILNEDGDLLSAFGGKGQGPGELQSPKELVISNQDEVFITDMGKVAVFSNTGRFIREFRIDNEYHKIIPLNKDRCLAVAVKLSEDLSQSFQVILCSSGMEELRILDSSKIESFKKAVKVNIIPTLVHFEKSDNHIYTGNTDEYEIRVFDFDGNLLRRIKKEDAAVSLSAKDKEEYEQRLQRYPPQIRESFFIPDAFPPIKDIVALGDKWLFVQTYEAPNDESSYYDIFNASGEFIGQTEFEGDQVKFKGDRVYCLKQKESGYKELVVYRIIWE
ncbi:MAG: 6-bladed beta-propeller [Deltaproteobacteria bacterium]|nr:6-bladed beta-propeller [Deltaproteobacteria bacterium]